MPALLGVFFLSGAAGLVYQVVWSRLLVLVLGATTEAFAITVASFMGGLALGSALAGRRAARLERPVRAYALLEAAIAAAAGLVPTALRVAEPVYLAVERAGLPGARLALTAAILLVPTSLMGATLPVLARLARERLGRSLGLLYGANTIGATLGSLLAGYCLIEALGLSGAARVAVGMNLLAALGALAVGGGATAAAPEAEIPRPTGESLGPRTAATVYLLSGFLSLALEILWTRLFVPRTGSEVYVFASILAVYLGGMGAGSLAYGARPAPSRRAFALAQALVGGAAVATTTLASDALYRAPLLHLYAPLAAATFAMGWAFPLGIALATPPGASAAPTTGRFYAWNTLGGIGGALAAVYLLAPTLGSGRAAGLLAAAYVALGAALLAPAERRAALGLAVTALAVAAAALAGTPGFLHPVFARVARERDAVLFAHAEDRVAAVTAGALLGPGRPYREYLLVNGIGMTMKTVDTKLLAHLPAALRPEARSALVLCFGMGTAYRSTLVHPYERVVAVDLVPTVPTFMRFYHADAETVLADPRGRVVIDDARHFLEATDETFEIISSDPPPPMNSAGTVLLYSREFYEAGRRRLAPGGVFVQWFPFEGGTLDDYRAHVRTFLAVFPHVSAWRSFDEIGFYLVGSEAPHDLDRARAAEVLGRETARTDIAEWTPSLRALAAADLAGSIAGLRFADRATLEAAAGAGPLITDDRPLTEYYWLRWRHRRDRSGPGWGPAVVAALGG